MLFVLNDLSFRRNFVFLLLIILKGKVFKIVVLLSIDIDIVVFLVKLVLYKILVVIIGDKFLR